MADNANRTTTYIREESFIRNESVTLVWGESLGYEDGQTVPGYRYINQTSGAVYNAASCPVVQVASTSVVPTEDERRNPLGLIAVSFRRID